ncbi:MAG: septum site-determining protein MinD, partial [Latilactobacillus curvatus]|nr:septum site-determining protein MinD [Latilactobacillus curvatus]
MGTALVITSGKGGVGKTTSSANIGTALALLDKKVCLLDLDIGLRNLDVVLGLSNRIIYDIVDVAQGRAKLHQALIKDKRFDEKIYLLPAAQNADKEALTPDEVTAIVNELKEEFDFVILDCPAGIESGFKNAIAGADGAIVVATPEISSVSDADRVVGLLEEEEMRIAPRLVINRIRRHMMNEGETMDVDEITK